MWGFGMRYAITSGVLAAKSILGEVSYEEEVRTKLLPLVKVSATNRFIMNRMGNRGFKAVAKYWMRDQKRTGDGLRFMRLIYKPGVFRRMLWPFVRFGMLAKGSTSDGRSYLRMPFRKALKRDDWTQAQRPSGFTMEKYSESRWQDLLQFKRPVIVGSKSMVPAIAWLIWAITIGGS